MSPESMLLSATPAAPSAPQPSARSAPTAASHSGKDLAADTGAGQTPCAPSTAPSGQNAQPRPASAPAQSAAEHTAHRKGAAGHKHAADQKHTAENKAAADRKHGASRTARAAVHSPQPAVRPAQPTGSFSQALAQSLATPGRGTSAHSNTVRGHGSPAGKPATHAPAKEGKSDPVVSALALVSQAPPAAPPAGAGPGKGQETVVSASLLGKTKDAGHGAKALLADATAQDLKTLGPAEGSTAAPPASASVNAAAVLTSAQAGVTTGTAAPTHAVAPSQAAANPTAALSAPVGTAAWTDQLGARLTWMMHQGIQSASLQLSPEHLGPLQVSISVHHGQASVWFGAAHAETRQALEQTMPQLRQMLSGQGLTLAESGVSRDTPRGQSPRKRSVGQIGAVAEESSGGLSSSVPAHIGLVDTYA